MSEEINRDRRRLLGTAVLTLAAAELAMIGFANAQSRTINPIKPGTNTSFSSLKQIDAGVLNVGVEWWYQFYFATERGREGYDKYRHDFSKLIWQLASPKWNFDDATFDRSAAAFDNPDHVSIVIHNYRWRLALAEGEPKYADLDKRLAEGPVITVPTITLEGDANGAPHLDPSAYARKFSGKYSHRTITGGIGHNLPQEAPQAFAQAVVDVDGY